MSHILVVGEKPSTNRAIAGAMADSFPGERVIYLSILPYVTPSPEYPRGRKWSEYPITETPSYSFENAFRIPPFERIDANQYRNVDDLSQDEMLHDATQIINACDPDHSGSVGFYLAMQHWYGDDIFHDHRVSSITLYALDSASIVKSVRQRGRFLEGLQDQVSYGLAKRYFDWNWNANSMVVLSEVMRRSGVADENARVSKYGLILLHALRGHSALSESNIITAMGKWKGTGKYDPSHHFGSPASRSAIIEQLEKAGLLDRFEGSPSTLVLSERGYRMLGMLHRDTFDPDLPARLDEWCAAGLGESRLAMDRYLRTFFGKQMEFMKKSTHEQSMAPEGVEWRKSLFAISPDDSYVEPDRPFNLPDLQFAAQRALKFSVVKTFQVASSLFEIGAITPPRTEVHFIPEGMVSTLKMMAAGLNEGRLKFDPSKVSIGGDQEIENTCAILPLPVDVSTMDEDQRAIYSLILNKTIEVIT